MITIIAITWPGFYLSTVTASLVYEAPSCEVIKVPASCAASQEPLSRAHMSHKAREPLPCSPTAHHFLFRQNSTAESLEVDTVGLELPKASAWSWLLVRNFPCAYHSSSPALYLTRHSPSLSSGSSPSTPVLKSSAPTSSLG